MTQATVERPSLDTGHVLAIDIGACEVLTPEDPVWLTGQALALLMVCPEYRRAQKSGDVVSYTERNGVVAMFFRDLEAPVRCALELAERFASIPHLKARVGIHSGPVFRGGDPSANERLREGAVAAARALAALGEPGHILVSGSVAGFLNQLDHWQDRFADYGEHAVGQAGTVGVYSLSGGAIGKAEPPASIAAAIPLKKDPAAPAAQPPRGSAMSGELPPVTAPRTLHFVLLYKRNAKLDEALLNVLEQQIVAGGHTAFIDRNLVIGVQWAQEIERQIRSSDAVIPLLSEASIASDMLAYEIQIAHDAAQEQEGKPAILPVRVGYDGSLPDALGSLLDPVEYFLWTSQLDTATLIRQINRALAGEEPTKTESLHTDEPRATSRFTMVPGGASEPVGGAVPLGSRFYVTRDSDDLFLSAIARQDGIVLLKGARQMGKTSLLARGLQQAREANSCVALTDFQKLNSTNLASADAFFLALGESLADNLELDVLPEQVWRPGRGASANFERYLVREVLAKTTTPLLWGLDEVDRVFSCEFGSEVFGLFRSWYNERALDPSGHWQRFTMAIAYATEAHLFISDQNQSPFNVGTRINLSDFTERQVAELNGRYGSPLKTPAELERYYSLVGGHPYLVRRGLQAMVSDKTDIAGFEATAARDDGPVGDHLRRILVLVARDPQLCEVLRGVLRGVPCPTPESFYRLRSGGVLVGDTVKESRIRCRLYATYLEQHLL